MNVVYQSAFLKALGWSLLDSFWQIGILWLIYVLLTAGRKKFNSTQKHTLALVSLAGGALWFLLSLASRFYQLVDSPTVGVGDWGNSVLDTSVVSIIAFVEPALPFLSLAYLLSVFYLFVRLYRQYYITQKLFYTNIQKAHPELRVFLKDIAARMGIKKNVSIWISSLVDSPLTVGFWKPVILLPVAAMNHLSLQQAEAIILHELNHIRRNDYFINLLIACMDIILFFNPFVRILTNIIKKERENSCDDVVLQFRYDATQYASALLLLERNRSSNRLLAINATGRSRKMLLNRVERILNRKSSGVAVNQKLIAYILSALLIGFIGLYNPGKVIVRTIETAQKQPAAVNAEQMQFTNRASDDQMTDNAPKAIPTIGKSATPTKNQKTDKKLAYRVAEEIGGWTTESEPGEAESSEEIPTLISFAGNESETREFSIPETAVPAPQHGSDVHPYVPSSSFIIQFMEDTAFPKKYVLSQADIKAKESMNTALKALEEVDWQKLEKELAASGKKVDVIKLHQELQKALTDVDWKKVNEEIQSSLIDSETELLKEHSTLHSEFKKFQSDGTQKKIQQQNILDVIIQERLCEEKSPTIKTERKKVVQKKKIVYI